MNMMKVTSTHTHTTNFLLVIYRLRKALLKVFIKRWTSSGYHQIVLMRNKIGKRSGAKPHKRKQDRRRLTRVSIM
jgi:hypothetical protein